MERRNAIILGTVAGVLLIGGIVAAVIIRRNALLGGENGTTPPPPPGGTTVISINQPASPPPNPAVEPAAIPGGAFNSPDTPGKFDDQPPPPNPGDLDGDGLSDAEETKLGTDKSKADTDGDGVADGDEVNYTKTDPKSSASKPTR